MSYILEALKKSEKERKRGGIPDLQADHSPPPLRRKKRQAFSWHILRDIVLFLLCCAGGLFWWQLGVEKKKQPGGKEPAVTSSASSSSQELQIPDKPVSGEQALSPRADTKTEGIEQIDSAVDSSRKVSSPETETVPVREEAILRGEADFVAPLLDELPVEVRAALPELSFAGHVYSDAPRKRLIIINNRIVREGDLIANGLFLEKIDREGVILRYETSIFRVKLF